MPGYKVPAGVPADKGWLCAHCKLLLRDAVQTEEGDRLCQSCCEEIRGYINTTSYKVQYQSTLSRQSRFIESHAGYSESLQDHLKVDLKLELLYYL